VLTLFAPWRLETTSGRRAKSSICSRKRPTVMRPASTAIVAGTAPHSRTAASISSAVAAFSGHGSPCVMSVDSSETTGRPTLHGVFDFRRQVYEVGHSISDSCSRLTIGGS